MGGSVIHLISLKNLDLVNEKGSVTYQLQLTEAFNVKVIGPQSAENVRHIIGNRRTALGR